MNQALDTGLIRDEDFPHLRRGSKGNEIDLDGTEFCKIVIDVASLTERGS